MDKQVHPKSELNQGIIILFILVVLTMLEYFLALVGVPNIFLWVIAIAKAAIILWFFMHIHRIFRQDGGH